MKVPWTIALLVCFGFSAVACGGGLPGETDDEEILARAEAIDADGPHPDELCTGAVAGGRAGQLDTSFGSAGTGIARLSFGADDDGAFFALGVSGDEIVAGGWGAGGLGGSSFRVARLTTSGSPDPAFAGGAMVTTRWAQSTADYAYAVAIGGQSDGGVIAMGWREPFKSESANIALVRHGGDGSVGGNDFGAAGKSLIDLGGAEEIHDGLVVQRDAILVVGRRDDDLLIARATAKGVLDTSFASPAGYWTRKIGRASIARAVAVDEEGRIVVVGSTERRGQHDLVVLRLSADGVLDRSFGAGGMVVTGDPTVDERAVAVALTRAGRIVVAGDAGPEKARALQLRRFLDNGSPDPSFGTLGVTSSVFPGSDVQAEDMVLLPEGGILVGGNDMADPNANRPLLARYTCRGGLDPAFGQGGVLPLDLGEFGVLHAVRVYGHDQVLVGGGDVGMSPGPGTYGVVARLWM